MGFYTISIIFTKRLSFLKLSIESFINRKDRKKMLIYHIFVKPYTFAMYLT